MKKIDSGEISNGNGDSTLGPESRDGLIDVKQLSAVQLNSTQLTRIVTGIDCPVFASRCSVASFSSSPWRIKFSAASNSTASSLAVHILEAAIDAAKPELKSSNWLLSILPTGDFDGKLADLLGQITDQIWSAAA